MQTLSSEQTAEVIKQIPKQPLTIRIILLYTGTKIEEALKDKTVKVSHDFILDGFVAIMSGTLLHHTPMGLVIHATDHTFEQVSYYATKKVIEAVEKSETLKDVIKEMVETVNYDIRAIRKDLFIKSEEMSESDFKDYLKEDEKKQKIRYELLTDSEYKNMDEKELDTIVEKQYGHAKYNKKLAELREARNKK